MFIILSNLNSTLRRPCHLVGEFQVDKVSFGVQMKSIASEAGKAQHT